MKGLKLALVLTVLGTLLVCGVMIPSMVLKVEITALRENNRNQIELKEHYKEKFEKCKNRLGVFYKEKDFFKKED